LHIFFTAKGETAPMANTSPMLQHTSY